jgi:hypothetical protein
MRELRAYPRKSTLVNASAKFPHWRWWGHQSTGEAASSGVDGRAVITSRPNGPRKGPVMTTSAVQGEAGQPDGRGAGGREGEESAAAQGGTGA